MSIFIPIDALVIQENRIRKIFTEEDIKSLAESIATFGLMQALVVQNDDKTLIGGERRYMAITLLQKAGKSYNYHGAPVPAGHIPVVRLAELSAIGVREAELEENIRRMQLTWQEKANAVRELHELRQEQAKAEGREYYLQDTAAEISRDNAATISRTEVHEDLLLSVFMDDPEVVKADSRKTAVKLVKRKLEERHRNKLAEAFDIKKLDTKHTLRQGDLFEILPTLAPASFDCIIADPPYGLGADKFRNMDARKHNYVDSESYSNHVIATIAQEGYRISKDKAHIYMLCDIERFFQFRHIFEEAGWKVFRTPLIWCKGNNVGLVPWPDQGPRRAYEAILYAVKGERRVTSIQIDVIYEVHERGIDYAAHKPPELYAALISRTCLPGDTVLDPCCGSGPIFPAADKTRTIATGIEIDSEAIGFCTQRLTAGKK